MSSEWRTPVGEEKIGEREAGRDFKDRCWVNIEAWDVEEISEMVEETLVVDASQRWVENPLQC